MGCFYVTAILGWSWGWNRGWDLGWGWYEAELNFSLSCVEVEFRLSLGWVEVEWRAKMGSKTFLEAKAPLELALLIN